VALLCVGGVLGALLGHPVVPARPRADRRLGGGRGGHARSSALVGPLIVASFGARIVPSLDDDLAEFGDPIVAEFWEL
jgi:hypothetical protein